MNSNYFVEPTEEELILAHHGILGQKWGIRRYQNPDGSLTEAGLKRYGSESNFKKIQDARAKAKAQLIKTKADAKAKSIEAKTAAKAEKRANKIELKRQKKLYKLKRKEAAKSDKEYYEREREARQIEREERNEAYKKQHKWDFAKEVANNVVKPAAFAAGRQALGKYTDKLIDDYFTDDATKLYKKTVNDLNRKSEITKLKAEISRNEMNDKENRMKSSAEFMKARKDSEISKKQADYAKNQADIIKSQATINENLYRTSDAHRQSVENAKKYKDYVSELKSNKEAEYYMNLAFNNNYENMTKKDLDEYKNRYKSAFKQ